MGNEIPRCDADIACFLVMQIQIFETVALLPYVRLLEASTPEKAGGLL